MQKFSGLKRKNGFRGGICFKQVQLVWYVGGEMKNEKNVYPGARADLLNGIVGFAQLLFKTVIQNLGLVRACVDAFLIPYETLSDLHLVFV